MKKTHVKKVILVLSATLAIGICGVSNAAMNYTSGSNDQAGGANSVYFGTAFGSAGAFSNQSNSALSATLGSGSGAINSQQTQSVMFQTGSSSPAGFIQQDGSSTASQASSAGSGSWAGASSSTATQNFGAGSTVINIGPLSTATLGGASCQDISGAALGNANASASQSYHSASGYYTKNSTPMSQGEKSAGINQGGEMSGLTAGCNSAFSASGKENILTNTTTVSGANSANAGQQTSMSQNASALGNATVDQNQRMASGYNQVTLINGGGGVVVQSGVQSGVQTQSAH